MVCPVRFEKPEFGNCSEACCCALVVMVVEEGEDVLIAPVEAVVSSAISPTENKHKSYQL